MKIIFACAVFACGLATAGTITTTGSNGPAWNTECPAGNPNTCVIGDPTVFGIQSASLTVSNTGAVSANIMTNFGDSTFTPFVDFGTTLSPADMIIQSGGNEFALVLNGHDGLNTGGLYEITGTENAQTVLGNPGGVIYRNSLAVWANPTGATLLGTGNVQISTVGNGVTGPEYDVAISGISGGSALYNSNLSLLMASATCGNGWVASSAVPEPSTMVLTGLSLIAACFGRRKLFHRR